MEVIHEGPLERCMYISDTKKETKKGYFVLKKLISGSKTLEFFKDSNWRKQEAKGVVNLFSGYTVNIINNTKHKKFTFELNTVDRTYELHGSNEQSRQKWVEVLNGGLVQSFSVTLINSPQSAYQFVKDLRGNCQLQVGESAVTLLATNGQSVTWRFSIIRRYKSQSGTFILEVGRKSVTGEGEFHFDTSNPSKLFDVLEKAVKERSKVKQIEDRSSGSTTPTVPIVSPIVPAIVPPVITSGQSTQRRPITPSDTRRRSAIDRSNKKTPEDDNEYSHINSIVSQHAAIRNELSNDYDQLFSSKRIISQRRSEPSVNPSHLPLFNGRKLSGENKAINEIVSETDDVYVEMAGNSDETSKNPPESKAKPLPPPRKSIYSPIRTTPSNEKGKLKKPLSAPTEENTYDAPNNNIMVQAQKSSGSLPQDYDELFKHVNNNIAEAPNYSHLNHGVATTQEGSVPTEDLISNKQNPQKQQETPVVSNRKVPLKPKRPSPMIPTQAGLNRQESRKALSPLSPVGGNVILKLKRNTIASNSHEQPTYDCPSSQPVSTEHIGYNQVGDLISGEYKKQTDLDGYVKVPNEPGDDDGDIYQVPRGE